MKFRKFEKIILIFNSYAVLGALNLCLPRIFTYLKWNINYKIIPYTLNMKISVLGCIIGFIAIILFIIHLIISILKKRINFKFLIINFILFIFFISFLVFCDSNYLPDRIRLLQLSEKYNYTLIEKYKGNLPIIYNLKGKSEIRKYLHSKKSSKNNFYFFHFTNPKNIFSLGFFSITNIYFNKGYYIIKLNNFFKLNKYLIDMYTPKYKKINGRNLYTNIIEYSGWQDKRRFHLENSTMLSDVEHVEYWIKDGESFYLIGEKNEFYFWLNKKYFNIKWKNKKKI